MAIALKSKRKEPELRTLQSKKNKKTRIKAFSTEGILKNGKIKDNNIREKGIIKLFKEKSNLILNWVNKRRGISTGSKIENSLLSKPMKKKIVKNNKSKKLPETLNLKAEIKLKRINRSDSSSSRLFMFATTSV